MEPLLPATVLIVTANFCRRCRGRRRFRIATAGKVLKTKKCWDCHGTGRELVEVPRVEAPGRWFRTDGR